MIDKRGRNKMAFILARRPVLHGLPNGAGSCARLHVSEGREQLLFESDVEVAFVNPSQELTG